MLLQDVPRLSEFAGSRDNNFNLIRMIAALGVLISHAYPIAIGFGTGEPLTQFLKGQSLGSVSVAVFFAISGFLIARSFDRSDTLSRFFVARALRLFPALVVALAFTVFFIQWVLADPPGSLPWSDAAVYFVRNLSLYSLQYELGAVFQANPFGPAINGSLWTLNHEVTCYLGVVALGLVGALRKKALMAFALLAFIALYIPVTLLEPHPRLSALFYLALPFITGTALYVWRDVVPLSAVCGLGLAALSVAAWFTPWFHEVFAVTLSYWVFLLGYLPGGAVRSYNRVGDFSYGTYIYAFPVQQYMVYAFGPMTPLENMFLAFPVTLVLAVISWFLIEKPSLAKVPRRAKPAFS